VIKGHGTVIKEVQLKPMDDIITYSDYEPPSVSGYLENSERSFIYHLDEKNRTYLAMKILQDIAEYAWNILSPLEQIIAELMEISTIEMLHSTVLNSG
jgi:hypothetical protein